jgi:hypothetical protein
MSCQCISMKATMIRSARFFLLLTVAGCAFVLSGQPRAFSQDDAKGDDGSTEITQYDFKEKPLPVYFNGMPALQAVLTPIPGSSKNPITSQGGIAGVCPDVVVTHSSSDFAAGTYVLQGGIVETEIAAATYTLPASAFPIKIELMEMIFGTSNASVQTTTQWSILVWEGTPNTGTLVAEYSSDGKILPHIVLPPGTSGMNVAVSVDPGDPEQIFITNQGGTNKFSVGYRIDEHNNPPTSSCACVLGDPSFGTLPAVCCPPSTASNAFPATDTSGLQQPSNNWIYARACPGATGFCQADEGWHTAGSIGISNDWVIRVTYSQINCAPGVGSCCTPSGSCLDAVTSLDCSAQGGTYQGDGTTCSTTNCPIPTGACCLGNGNCSIQTLANCNASGGTYMGTNTTCSTDLCKGACCVPSSQSCVNFTQNNCTTVNGVFQGMGTACATTTCFGACCLPDGSCLGGQTEQGCANQNGVFFAGFTCAQVNCPQPVGRCCFNEFCLENISEVDCDAIVGVWGGPLSTCAGGNPCGPTCPADIAPSGGNGSVDVDDLLSVINSWGPCAGCDADVAPEPDGNNSVDVDDLLMIINSWGPCN